jgi:membrane protein
MPSEQPRLLQRIAGIPQRLRSLIESEIWTSDALEDKSLRGRVYAVLRVVALIWSGLVDHKLISRAAALSYSSLLAIGPLIAIGVLFSGFILNRADTDEIVGMINKGITFIAPQVVQFQEVSEAAPDATDSSEVLINPNLTILLENFIDGSRSATVGVVGGLMLILIVVQLFSSIEDAFNTIWGVRRGRNWLARIVIYWTVVTLGAVLAFASLTLLSASTLVASLEHVPMGGQIYNFLNNSAWLVSFVVLTVLLTLFYRFIPSTRVNWGPAILGALIVVLLLNLNNHLAFMYFRRVVLAQSLYGSVGILLVLMVGLYVFWLIVLSGGQITYALQNASFQSSRVAWNALSFRTRELVSFLVLGMICRRFQTCQTPYTASELAGETRIPNQLLNESLSKLQDLKLVTAIPHEESDSFLDHSFQPSRPLESIGVSEFRHGFADLGARPAGIEPEKIDPVVASYWKRGREAITRAYGATTMADFVKDSIPPDPPADQTD